MAEVQFGLSTFLCFVQAEPPAPCDHGERSEAIVGKAVPLRRPLHLPSPPVGLPTPGDHGGRRPGGAHH